MENENKFKKGDIIKNLWAGENNPNKCLLYIGKSSVKQGRYTQKTYRCIGYDGSNVHLLRDNARIEVVGHMDEFDAFLSALKALNNIRNND